MLDFFKAPFIGLKRLLAQPFATFLTTMALAAAMIMPVFLYVLQQSSAAPLSAVQQNAQMTIFLNMEVSDATNRITDQLSNRPEVEEVLLASKQEVWEHFKHENKLDAIINRLDEPLPETIYVKFKAGATKVEIEIIKAALEQMPEVAMVHADFYWEHKLVQIFAAASLVFWLIATILLLVFVLVVFLTTRIANEVFKAEINLSLLLGAGRSYIIPKFAFVGFWSGLFAGIICIVLVNLSVWWLNNSLSELGVEPGFAIRLLNLRESILIIISSALIALLTAWQTCATYILKMEKTLSD